MWSPRRVCSRPWPRTGPQKVARLLRQADLLHERPVVPARHPERGEVLGGPRGLEHEQLQRHVREEKHAERYAKKQGGIRSGVSIYHGMAFLRVVGESA